MLVSADHAEEDATPLTDISEVQVLLVGDIPPSHAHGVVPLVAIGELLVPTPVGDDEAHAEREDDNNFRCAGAHADDDPRSVRRGLGGEEAVGSDDVAHRDAEEDGGGREDLLGRSADVAGDEGETEDEDGVGRSGEVCVGRGVSGGAGFHFGQD
jgi:hypothetical protein